MSTNLKNYISHNEPRSATPSTPGRRNGGSLKVSANRATRAGASALPPQPYSNPVQNHRYDLKSISRRDAYPVDPQQQTIQPQYDALDNFGNTTLTSGFEDTKSDTHIEGPIFGREKGIPYNAAYSDQENLSEDAGLVEGGYIGEDEYGRRQDLREMGGYDQHGVQGYLDDYNLNRGEIDHASNEYMVPTQALHHKQSHTQLKSDQLQGDNYKPSITGRFTSPLEVRPGSGHSVKAENQRSKKRSHEPHEKSPRNTHYHHQRPHGDRAERQASEPKYMERDISRQRTSKRPTLGRSLDLEEIDVPKDASHPENSRHQPQTAQLEISQSPTSVILPQPIGPDYNDAELKRKSFSELRNESWELAPGAPAYDLPEELQGPDVTMDQKLDFFLKGDADPAQELVQATAFFTNISKIEWDEAGDVLLHKMTSLMQGVKAARQKKRQKVCEIESEYDSREQSIRRKSKKLDTELDQMRSRGVTVIPGKRD